MRSWRWRAVAELRRQLTRLRRWAAVASLRWQTPTTLADRVKLSTSLPAEPTHRGEEHTSKHSTARQWMFIVQYRRGTWTGSSHVKQFDAAFHQILIRFTNNSSSHCPTLT